MILVNQNEAQATRLPLRRSPFVFYAHVLLKAFRQASAVIYWCTTRRHYPANTACRKQLRYWRERGWEEMDEVRLGKERACIDTDTSDTELDSDTEEDVDPNSQLGEWLGHLQNLSQAVGRETVTSDLGVVWKRDCDFFSASMITEEVERLCLFMAS
ncbi:unnamed protein product [Soboliphyme baturini]|uniref:DDE_Tnp_1_7 domain-containing protein n=1 Tax=Soboliphyme baturini TaxID=241478 RepID=A0A183IHT7_9BILA|nr:unnamed protein product [Soboliphyme baturini]